MALREARPNNTLRMPRSAKSAALSYGGIWYLVKYPEKWILMVHKFDPFEDWLDHSQFWESTIAPLLTSRWRLSATQASEIRLLVYGFPRGRVVKTPEGHTIFNGQDFANFFSEVQIA